MPKPRKPPASIRRTAVELDRVLRRTRARYALVGGFASGIWGRPRATHDVDAAVLLRRPSDAALLVRHARKAGFRPDKSARKAADTGFLTVRRGKDRADLALAQFKYDTQVVERARSVRAFRRILSVATPEDTIVLKALSGRPIDEFDVAGILQRRRVDRDYVRAQAARFGPATLRWVDRLLASNPPRRKN